MKLYEVAAPDARFFLKSEYGPLSADWPVVAFSQKSFETLIGRNYRSVRDFIVYLGTKGGENPVATDRGRLLSVIAIDTTRILSTYDYISPSSREWASKAYPGQWLRCFRFTQGFDIPARPAAAELFADTDLNMWHVQLREVIGRDRDSLLEIEVERTDVIVPGLPIETALTGYDLLRQENRAASQEAVRLASLVFNRVSLSGQLIERRAPERSAPTDLQLQILGLLLKSPLICSLCFGSMQLLAENKLLRISGDRKDSTQGDYGPANYQLVHLACNLAKNDASEEDFEEWLEVVRGSAA